MIVECVTSSRNCRFSAVNSFLQNLSRYPQHKLFPTNACQARNKKQERVMGNGWSTVVTKEKGGEMLVGCYEGGWNLGRRQQSKGGGGVMRSRGVVYM